MRVRALHDVELCVSSALGAFRCALLVLALHATVPTGVLSQESVEADVARALRSLNEGRMEEYLAHFLEGARVLITFHEDNGGAVEIGPEDVRGSLSKLTWSPREIITQVFGSNAVT